MATSNYETQQQNDDKKDENNLSRELMEVYLNEYFLSLLKFEKCRRETNEEITDAETQMISRNLIRMMPSLRLHSQVSNEWIEDSFTEKDVVKDILQSSFKNTMTWYNQSLNKNRLHSVTNWGLEEGKRGVLALGIRLSTSLIRLTLFNVSCEGRKKQMSLKRWIFGQSYEKGSALMYLIDFLLSEAEDLAGSETDPSPINRSQEKDFDAALFQNVAAALCNLQIIASNLCCRLFLPEQDFSATHFQYVLCQKQVRLVEDGINPMKETALRLHCFDKGRPSRGTVKESQIVFWKSMNPTINDCWCEKFWAYIDTTTRLQSIIGNNQILYSLSLRF